MGWEGGGRERDGWGERHRETEKGGGGGERQGESRLDEQRGRESDL